MRRSPYLYEEVRTNWRNWRAAGAPRRVLRWVRQGVPCYWKDGPPQHPWNKGRSCDKLGAEEQEWLEREEERLVRIGAWRRVRFNRYVSKAFVIPKVGVDSEGRRKFRMILDLRPLNVYVKDFKTRFETLARLGTVIADGEKVAFVSFDLQDGYFYLQIDPEFQKYFGINIQGRMYQANVLPFGWSTSPYAFCTAMKTLTRLLRAASVPTAEAVGESLASARGQAVPRLGGLRVGNRKVRVQELSRTALSSVKRNADWLPYIDDYLATVKGSTEAVRMSRAEAEKEHADSALDFLGLRKQPEKGQWDPKPTVAHLGYKVDSEKSTFEATGASLAKIKRGATNLIYSAMRNRRLVNGKQLRSFCGLVQSKYLAIAPAQLFLRSLHNDLAAARWSSSVRLSRQSLRDLQLWKEESKQWNGSPIAKAPVTRLLYSDASEYALGGTLVTTNLQQVVPEKPGLKVPGQRWHRALTVEEQKEGIFCGEVRAIVETIENFLPELRGQVVQFMEDNQGAMFATRRLVSSNPVALALLRRLWIVLGANRIRLQEVDWVASADNPADAPSRWRFSDEWQLHPAVFRWANRELGPHTLDLFASRNTAQLPRFVTRFPDARAVAYNAWAHSWAGERCWINTSWDDLEKVAQRLELEPAASATVVCPYFPVQPWFQRLAVMADRVLVCPFDQRWVLRPQQQQSAPLGPAEWSLALMVIPARRPGFSGGRSFASKMQWVPPFSVSDLVASDQREPPDV